jgi:hypothetical protein
MACVTKRNTVKPRQINPDIIQGINTLAPDLYTQYTMRET